ncbi:hypothetical protein [Fimbriimonas ginsengisoli]|uniref:Uncharacterized protein n=1 Tax=Fimbriimonas ginsengisoli Gsoil 348 TaxID=661478 RepID=A0A068NJ02_FIMGI|nr:hypothetical protein [Fimbriimonas ginsengisoli]AIE83447.1 hypothetical protein OP10G_0079 [Fimbriimonas ginsengisoli Gsoil 348]
MTPESREAWVGNHERFGILQRLGMTAFIISFAFVFFSFDTPGDASIRYAMFVAAHALLYLGFTIAAVADRIAGRPFSFARLVYVAGMWFLYCVLGPIVMAAATAAVHRS